MTMFTSGFYGTRRNASGFSMLEVLIALLVLSVGLLGLAGLQTFSLKFNHQSYERTQATIMISDMLDRIRANPQGLATYAAAPAPGVDCVATTCTNGPDIAAYDVDAWQKSLNRPGMLAGGAGTIQVNGSVVTVTVTWNEENDSGPITLSQVMTAQVFQ